MLDHSLVRKTLDSKSIKRFIRVEEAAPLERPKPETWQSKENWGAGPWQKEPDVDRFVSVGFLCLLQRSSSGSWCGYVRVTEDHPWFKKGYNKPILRNVTVHGGLTWAGKDDIFRTHLDFDGLADREKKGWWVGFDTAHSHDHCPALNVGIRSYEKLFPITRYKTLKYSKAELRKLAKQAKLALESK